MSLKGKVSIVVPYFNSRNYIERLVHSVKNQSYREFECVLVDDGGNDGTFELLEEVIRDDDRFINMKRPANVSPGGRGAKNHGYSASDGEFIVFFDSDDIMYPDYLSGRVRYLIENPGKDGVVSDFGWRVREGERKRIFRYNRRIFDDFKDNARQDWFWLNYMDYRFFFGPGNPMWRRSSLDGKPLWDVTTSIGEDHEYHARLFLAGLDIGIIDGVHWDYMANTDSMIMTSESVKPLLSRSYGKILVLKSLNTHLGKRPVLIRKELTCQVKILRRIMSCNQSTELKRDAVETMLGRIRGLMEQLGYGSVRKTLVISGLRTAMELDRRFGRSHRLYSWIVPDTVPTDEKGFFNISSGESVY